MHGPFSALFLPFYHLRNLLVLYVISSVSIYLSYNGELRLNPKNGCNPFIVD